MSRGHAYGQQGEPASSLRIDPLSPILAQPGYGPPPPGYGAPPAGQYAYPPQQGYGAPPPQPTYYPPGSSKPSGMSGMAYGLMGAAAGSALGAAGAPAVQAGARVRSAWRWQPAATASAGTAKPETHASSPHGVTHCSVPAAGVPWRGRVWGRAPLALWRHVVRARLRTAQIQGRQGVACGVACCAARLAAWLALEPCLDAEGRVEAPKRQRLPRC